MTNLVPAPRDSNAVENGRGMPSHRSSPLPDSTFDLLTMADVARLLHCSKAHVCNIVAGRVQGC